MRKIAFLSILSLILFSCEKEQLIIPGNSGIPLISKVLIGDETYMIYSYNEANLIKEEKSKFHYTHHYYNKSNQLTASDFYWDVSMASSNSSVIEAAMNRKEWISPENTEKSLTQKFEYDKNGHLERKIFIRQKYGGPEYLLYTWENDKIIRRTGYLHNVISGYIDFFYDDRGNLAKEIKYTVLSGGAPELTTTTEYEYDNMNNPYQAFSRLMTPGKYTNPNNIVKETYTLHFEVDPWIEKVQATNYSYQYNDEDYPIRVNGYTEYIYK
jgi:hypothetical protein